MDRGMTFTDAHTPSSVCTPTRYGIMTGTYAWRTNLKKGVLNGYSKALIADSTDTSPKILQRNGYTTALIGKWHLGWDWAVKDKASNSQSIEQQFDFNKPFSGGPTNHGFDYFYGIAASLDFPPYVYCENNKAVNPVDDYFKGNKKEDDKLVNKQKMQRKGPMSKEFDAQNTLLNITQHSTDYIKKQKANQPFFLLVSFTSPHTPVLPRDAFKGKSKAGIYGDFVQEMDWSVGQIMQSLKQMGFDKNTLVIFTADNGASRISFPIEFESKYGHKPSRELHGRKGTMHEGGHHIPFVAVWDGKIKPKSECATPIVLTDFYATFADMMKEKTKDTQGLDSYSFLALLDGKTNSYKRKESIYSNSGGYFSIRKGKWKMDMHPKLKKRKLYDIIADRGEKHNLYLDDKYDSIRKELLSDLTKTILNGSSKGTGGVKIDSSEVWPQIFWLNNNFTK